MNLFSLLLTKNKVKATWDNILENYKYSGLNADLIKFIEKNILEIKGSADGSFIELIEDIINSTIDKDAFILLMEHFPLTITLDDDFISDENLSIFIQKGKGTFQTDDFDHLVGKPLSLESYISYHWEVIVDNFNTFFNLRSNHTTLNLKEKMIKQLLLSTQISTEIKLEMFDKLIRGNIFTNYDNELIKVISENNFEISIGLLNNFRINQLTTDSDKQFLIVATKELLINTHQLKII